MYFQIVIFVLPFIDNKLINTCIWYVTITFIHILDTFIPGGNKRKKFTKDNHVVKKKKVEKKDGVKLHVSKDKSERTSKDKNAKTSNKEGKTPLQIMMERKKKKKKLQEKKKNKRKGKKRKVWLLG